MSHFAVVGGGASGLLTAILLAKKSHTVSLFEANRKLGKKILASGNGHCNISNKNITLENFHGFEPSFLDFSLQQFNFSHLEKLFKSFGLLLQVKNDGKAYPQSYEAKSVNEIFKMTAENMGVKIHYNQKIHTADYNEGFTLKSDEEDFSGYDYLVLATGGQAAPALGGNDSGYSLARSFGHEIAPLYPSLVQLELKGNEYESMSGVKHLAQVKLLIDKQEEGFFDGDVLFTRYGISGLAILDLSQKASAALHMGSKVDIVVNFFPGTDRQKLDSQIAGLCKQLPKACLLTLLSTLIHSKILTQIFQNLDIDISSKASDIDAKGIKKIVNLLLNWKFFVEDTHGFTHSEVCGGGVLTSEVNEKSMESKKQKGLYLVGEVLDLVGDRGGYNFHLAFATAFTLASSFTNA